LLPVEAIDPRVLIRPGRATLACRYRENGLETVMSIDVELYMAEPNAISLRLCNARAGSIPVPLGEIIEGLSQAATDANLDLRWLKADGDPVAIVRFLPPRDEDDMVYQLETMELREGELYVAGRTSRGGSEQSPTWDPEFKPVASFEPATKETIQR
jgi:hypothetical protein